MVDQYLSIESDFKVYTDRKWRKVIPLIRRSHNRELIVSKF